jgi:hypothetical protein
VALANTGTTLPGDFIHEVLSILLPSYREKRAKDTGKISRVRMPPLPLQW